MEQHPVPQNITGFQFKLIGDMTIKQFAYLAGGIIGGYLVTLLSMPVLLKWPIAITLGFLGSAFAFVPIEERPLDRWLKAFFKAIYTPTQFIWKKSPIILDFLISSGTNKQVTVIPEKELKKPETKLKEYLKTLPSLQKSTIDETENTLLQKLDFGVGSLVTPLAPTQKPGYKEDLLAPLPQVRVHKLKPAISGEIIFPIGEKRLSKIDINLPEPKFPTPDFPPSPYTQDQTMLTTPVRQISEEEIKPASLSRFLEDNKKVEKPKQKNVLENSMSKDELEKLRLQNEGLNEQIKKFQEDIEKLQGFALETTEGKIRLKEMLSRYEDALKQKERSVQEIASLRRQNEEIQKIFVVPGKAIPKSTPRVQFVAAESAKGQGLPILTQTPNVVTGIVTDQKGGILQGVILTIKDKQGNPVRAIKTSAVGQFRTGTPLGNGHYSIELEKEGYNFDIISLEVKGDVLSPLEIKAK